MPTFETILRQFHDKVTAQNIADTLANNPDRIPELMDCFLHEEMRICQRASWPLGMLGKSHPELLYPYIDDMLKAIENPVHNAVVRNTLRTFQFMDFPEEIEGKIFDISLHYLMDMESAVAFKVFGMTVCYNISMKYPELAEELIPIIEEQMPHGSTGFKNRGAKLLLKLRKLAER